MLSDLRVRKLKCLFAAFDGDKDGVLTDDDPQVIIASLAALAGLDPETPQRAAFAQGFLAYWRDFIMTSDLDRDGKVTIDEWLTYHEEMLTDARRFEMTAAMSAGVMFALVDRDPHPRTGIVEGPEFIPFAAPVAEARLPARRVAQAGDKGGPIQGQQLGSVVHHAGLTGGAELIVLEIRGRATMGAGNHFHRADPRTQRGAAGRTIQIAHHKYPACQGSARSCCHGTRRQTSLTAPGRSRPACGPTACPSRAGRFRPRHRSAGRRPAG